MKNLTKTEQMNITGGFGYHRDQSWYDGAKFSRKYANNFLGGIWESFSGSKRYRPCECDLNY